MSLPTSPRPARLLAALVALVVVALLAPACGVSNPDALVVDGRALTRSDFMAQLDAVAGDPAALQGLFGQATTEGDAPGTYSTGFTAAMLQLHVLGDAFGRMVDERGLTISDEDRQQASEQLTAGGISGDLAGLTAVLVDVVAAQGVVAADVQAGEATDEALRALFDALPADQRQVACASHILVLAGSGQAAPTEAEYATALAEIQAAQADLAAGADFATVATARSGDTGSAARGGNLGCQPPGIYVPEFDEAVWTLPVGTTSEPVRTAYGYHLIRVEERRERTFEEAREELATSLAQQSQGALQEILVSALSQLDVTVDGQFGRWDAEAGQVVPPEGAEEPPATDAPLDEELPAPSTSAP